MNTVRKIRLIHDAGEPDSVLARRIDIVIHACALVDAWSRVGPDNHFDLTREESQLELAVRRYKDALKHRERHAT